MSRARGAPVPDAVIKVGGSLCGDPAALSRLMRALARLARRRTILVVPGGGGFADEVRRADRRFAPGDSAAHWMAILAMDQSAYLMAALAGRAVVVAHARAQVAAGRLNVLAPFAWLRRADPLPHSWSVTSDSIAAWIARVVRARRLILLKDVDGRFTRDPKRGGRARLQREVARDHLPGVVDGYFPRALARTTRCWIVNGRHPERVVKLMRTGRVYGTEVVAPARRRSG